MSIKQALFEELTTTASITALVESRVYPTLLPQNPTLPAIRYQVIASPKWHAHDGPLALRKDRIQVDCFAETYSQAKTLANTVRAVLSGYNGLMGDTSPVEVEVFLPEGETDGFDLEAQIKQISLDFIAIYKT